MTRFHETQDGPSAFTPEEEAQRDAEDAAWEQGESERKATALRTERNRLLSLTDWRALADAVLTPAWATYRQQLRDVPQQPGFPGSMVWPEVPRDAA